jgi:hypothetical protein
MRPVPIRMPTAARRAGHLVAAAKGVEDAADGSAVGVRGALAGGPGRIGAPDLGRGVWHGADQAGTTGAPGEFGERNAGHHRVDEPAGAERLTSGESCGRTDTMTTSDAAASAWLSCVQVAPGSQSGGALRQERVRCDC